MDGKRNCSIFVEVAKRALAKWFMVEANSSLTGETMIARSLVVLALCAFSLALAWGAPQQAATETQITATLRQMFEAEKRRDLKFVLSHLAGDFAEVAGDGKIYHRADIQAGWADVRLNDYKLSDCVFKRMTADAAYLSCALQVDATYQGQPFPKQLRVTTVWTRRQGDWQIRFEQATVIPGPAKE
jgi:ketosteroid isomerase-like protein